MKESLRQILDSNPPSTPAEWIDILKRLEKLGLVDRENKINGRIVEGETLWKLKAPFNMALYVCPYHDFGKNTSPILYCERGNDGKYMGFAPADDYTVQEEYLKVIWRFTKERAEKWLEVFPDGDDPNFSNKETNDAIIEFTAFVVLFSFAVLFCVFASC
jgi:hypothetical protein